MHKKRYLLLCIVALIAGGLVYILIKERSHIHLIAEEIISFQFGVETKNEFVKNHLGDFLWAFSLTMGLFFILGDKLKQRVISVLIAVAYGVVWEAAQLFCVVSGTGDAIDIGMYFLAGAIAFIFTIKEEKCNEKNS